MAVRSGPGQTEAALRGKRRATSRGHLPESVRCSPLAPGGRREPVRLRGSLLSARPHQSAGQVRRRSARGGLGSRGERSLGGDRRSEAGADASRRGVIRSCPMLLMTTAAQTSSNRLSSAVVAVAHSFEGPLPPPDILAGYESVLPALRRTHPAISRARVGAPGAIVVASVVEAGVSRSRWEPLARRCCRGGVPRGSDGHGARGSPCAGNDHRHCGSGQRRRHVHLRNVVPRTRTPR